MCSLPEFPGNRDRNNFNQLQLGFVCVVEFQGHRLNQWVSWESMWVPGAAGGSGATLLLCNLNLCEFPPSTLPFLLQHDCMNGGGSHSSSRPFLQAGGVSSFLLVSFPLAPISQVKSLPLPSFALCFGEPGSQISLKVPNYKPPKIITTTFLNSIMGWFAQED